MFVVDASVLIADLRPSEPHHRPARELLDRVAADDATIFAPEIALVEVASGLARGTSDYEIALRAAHLLRRQRGIRFVAVDAELADRAVEIAAMGHVRGCDTVYLALARVLSLPAVTLDRQQRERAPDSIEALTPSAMLARLDQG